MQAHKNVSWRWRPALSVLVALVYCAGTTAKAAQDEIVLTDTVYTLTTFSLPMVFPAVAQRAADFDFTLLKKNLSSVPIIKIAALPATRNKKLARHISLSVATRKTAALLNRKRRKIVDARSSVATNGQPVVLAPAMGWLDDPKNLKPASVASSIPSEPKPEVAQNIVTPAPVAPVIGWLDDPKNIKSLAPAAPVSVAQAPTQSVIQQAEKPVPKTLQPQVAQQSPAKASISNNVQPIPVATVLPVLSISSQVHYDKPISAVQPAYNIVQNVSATTSPAVATKKTDISPVADAPLKQETAATQDKPEKPEQEVHFATLPAEEKFVPQQTAAAITPVKEQPLKPQDEPVITPKPADHFSERKESLVTVAMPFIPVTSATDQSNAVNTNPVLLQPLPGLSAQASPSAPATPPISSQSLPALLPQASPPEPAGPPSALQPLSIPSPQATQSNFAMPPIPSQPLPIPVAQAPQTSQPPQPAVVPARSSVLQSTSSPVAVPPPPDVASVPAMNDMNHNSPSSVSPVIENALSGDSSQLPEQTRRIVRSLPPEKPTVEGPVSNEPVLVDHQRPNPMEDETEVKKHEGVGIEITVQQPKLNITRALENAYNDLVEGDQQDAIDIYQQVLKVQPRNTLALFGLATTYHRAGQLEMARPLYGKLLAIDPQNKEGLNNFLVLIADESPQAALVELEKLQHTHPEFSPIPAQLALIHQRLGEYRKAAECMQHAIELSPANLKYRYDMAVILDKGGFRAEAIEFYQQLVNAYLRGEKIPAKIQDIQERLTFIRSNKQ